jgi:hypothetical protein
MSRNGSFCISLGLPVDQYVIFENLHDHFNNLICKIVCCGLTLPLHTASQNQLQNHILTTKLSVEFTSNAPQYYIMFLKKMHHLHSCVFSNREPAQHLFIGRCIVDSDGTKSPIKRLVILLHHFLHDLFLVRISTINNLCVML